jgi:L-ascorbate metabolism protein UlaG (beta-lactamase superfamily)
VGGAVEGTRVVAVINPDTVIPIHHSTFPFYVEPVAEFARRLGASAYRGSSPSSTKARTGPPMAGGHE